jgi:hypothetical protein
LSDSDIELEEWRRPQHERHAVGETGFLDDGAFMFAAQALGDSSVARELHLVHISELIAHDKLSLRTATVGFEWQSENEEPIAPQSDIPPYCVLSHSWVDNGMPDTEDGKFFRAFLLVALSIYIETGIEYFWIDYLCVTQNPGETRERAKQIGQIPRVVRHASFFANMCLEIHQYRGSAWCALETLLYIGGNENCRPVDFVRC